MPLPEQPFAVEPSSCSSSGAGELQPLEAAPAQESAAAAAAAVAAVMQQHVGPPRENEATGLPLLEDQEKAAGFQQEPAAAASSGAASGALGVSEVLPAEAAAEETAAAPANIPGGNADEGQLNTDGITESRSLQRQGETIPSNCNEPFFLASQVEGRHEVEQHQQRFQQHQQQRRQQQQQQQQQGQQQEPRTNRIEGSERQGNKRQPHNWSGPPPDYTRPVAAAAAAAPAAAAEEEPVVLTAAAGYDSTCDVASNRALTVPEPPIGVAALAAAAFPNIGEACMLQRQGLEDTAISHSRCSWAAAAVHAAAAAAAVAAGRAPCWASCSPEGGKSTTDTRSPASPCNSSKCCSSNCCCSTAPPAPPLCCCCLQQQHEGSKLPAPLLMLQMQSYFVCLLQYLRDSAAATAAIEKTAAAHAAANAAETNYAHHLQVILGSSCTTLQHQSKARTPPPQPHQQQQQQHLQQSAASGVHAIKAADEPGASPLPCEPAAGAGGFMQQNEEGTQACTDIAEVLHHPTSHALSGEQPKQQLLQKLRASESFRSSSTDSGGLYSPQAAASVESCKQQEPQDQRELRHQQQQQPLAASNTQEAMSENQRAARQNHDEVNAAARAVETPEPATASPSVAGTAAEARVAKAFSNSNSGASSCLKHGLSWACAAVKLGCPDVEALPPRLYSYICVFSQLLLRGPHAAATEAAAIAAEATQKLTLLRLQQQQEGRQQEAQLLLQLQQAHNEFLVLQQQQEDLQQLKEQLAKHEEAKGTVAFASGSSSRTVAPPAKTKCAHTFASPVEEDTAAPAAAAKGSATPVVTAGCDASNPAAANSEQGPLKVVPECVIQQEQQQLPSANTSETVGGVAASAAATALGGNGGLEEKGGVSGAADEESVGAPSQGPLPGLATEAQEAPCPASRSSKEEPSLLSGGVLAAATDFCVDAAGALLDDDSDASPRYCHAAAHGCSSSSGVPPLSGAGHSIRGDTGAGATAAHGSAPGAHSLGVTDPAVEWGSHWGIRRCSRRARALQQSRALRAAAAEEAAAAEDEGLGSEGSTDSAAGAPRRGGRQQQHKAKGYYPGGSAGASGTTAPYCAPKKRSDGVGGSSATHALTVLGSKQRKDQQQLYMTSQASTAVSAAAASGVPGGCGITLASLPGYGGAEKAARLKRLPGPRPRGGAVGAFSLDETDGPPRKRSAAASAAPATATTVGTAATAASAPDCLLASGSDNAGGALPHIASGGAPSVSGSESGLGNGETLKRTSGPQASEEGPFGFGGLGNRRQQQPPSCLDDASRSLPGYDGPVGSLEGHLASLPGGASSPLGNAAGLGGSAACMAAAAGVPVRGGAVVTGSGGGSAGQSAGINSASSRVEALSEDLNEEMRPMKGVYFDRTQKSWIGSFYEERRQIKKRFKVATYGYHTAKALAINVRLGFERKARMRGDETKDSHPAAHAERLLAGATEAALAAGEAGIDTNKEAQLRLLLHSAESGSTAHLPRSELLQQILRRQPKTYDDKKHSHRLVAAAAAASTTAPSLTPRTVSDTHRALSPAPTAASLANQQQRWPSESAVSAAAAAVKGESPPPFLKPEKQQQLLRQKPRSCSSSSAIDDPKTVDATAAAAAAAAAAATPCSAVAAAEFAAAVAALRCSLNPNDEAAAARGGGASAAALQQQQQLRRSGAAAAASESGDNNSQEGAEEDLDEAFHAAIRESRDPTSIFAQALDVSNNSLAFLHPPAALQHKQQPQQQELPQGFSRGGASSGKQHQLGRSRVTPAPPNPASCPSTAAGSSTPLDSPTSNAATPSRSKVAVAVAAAGMPRPSRLIEGRPDGQGTAAEANEAFDGALWERQPAVAAEPAAATDLKEPEHFSIWRSGGCEAGTQEEASDAAAKGGVARGVYSNSKQSSGSTQWEEERGPEGGGFSSKKSYVPPLRPAGANCRRDTGSSRAAADAKKLQEQQQRLAGLAAATAALSQAHGLGDTAHLQKQLLEQLQQLQRQQEQLQPQPSSGETTTLLNSTGVRTTAPPAAAADVEADMGGRRVLKDVQQFSISETAQQQHQQLHAVDQQQLQSLDGSGRRAAGVALPFAQQEQQQQQQQPPRDGQQSVCLTAAETVKGLLHANPQAPRTSHRQRAISSDCASQGEATVAPAAPTTDGSGSSAGGDGVWSSGGPQDSLVEESSSVLHPADDPAPASWRGTNAWGAAAAVP